MSLYSTGVDAYRDTTKWLVAFVPITAIAGAGVATGPRLIRSLDASTGASGWLEDHWPVLVCALLLLGSLVAIVWTGASVLSTQPSDIGTLGSGQPNQDLAQAIGDGAAAPYFFDKNSFDSAMAAIANGYDAGTIKADDATLARLSPAIDSLRDWSVYQRVQEPFRRFRFAFTGGATAIVVSIVWASALLGSSPAIDKPTAVDVTVETEGAASLLAATGCTDPSATVFTAIGGTWEEPQLAADGPNCRFGAVWSPNSEQAEIRLPAAASK